jgi:hypothetical protein
MRKLLLIAGVAALVIPGIASAEPGCREQQHENRVAGTVVGAGFGAILGGVITGKPGGAVLGALGGGVVGNVAAGSSTNCDNGHYDANGVWHYSDGYYDNAGAWHTASGAYDGDGKWVEGAGPSSAPPAAGDYGADVAYTGGPDDISGREDWIEHRVQRGEDGGAISHFDAATDRSRLGGIRDLEARLSDRHDGLTGDDRANIGARLDDLSAAVGNQWRPAD